MDWHIRPTLPAGRPLLVRPRLRIHYFRTCLCYTPFAARGSVILWREGTRHGQYDLLVVLGIPESMWNFCGATSWRTTSWKIKQEKGNWHLDLQISRGGMPIVL